MTVVALLQPLLTELNKLAEAFDKKAAEFDSVIKMGRTQMQDAVPVRLGQEFAAYASATRRAIRRIEAVQAEMHPVNMGGTAIGTGINADLTYFDDVTKVLAELTGVPYFQAADMIDGTQHIDCFAAVSGVLKTTGLFQSITALTGAVKTFTVNCVEGITANEAHCLELLNASVGPVTAACPYIGYAKAAAIAKETLKTGVPVRILLVEKGAMTAEEVERVLDTKAMTEPGVPGKN